MLTVYKRLGLVLLSTCTGLAIAEGICRSLRMSSIDDHVFDSPQSGHPRFQIVADLGYEHIPNANPEINSLGLRGPETTLEKPPDTFRVLVVGDSIAYGYGVEPADAFAGRLQQRLARRYPHQAVEVLNAGVSGYNTRQELMYLKQRGLAFEPDVVILSYCPNDIAVTPIVFQEGDDYVFYTPDANNTLYNAQLIKASALFRLMMMTYETRKTRREGLYRQKTGFRGLYSLDRQGNMEALREMARLLKARDIPMLCIIFPYFQTEFADYAKHLMAVHDGVAATLAEEGVAVVDLLDSWKDMGIRKLKRAASADFVHPNELGHDLAAGEILTWIVKERVVEDNDREQ